jgi:hypothetical protein
MANSRTLTQCLHGAKLLFLRRKVGGVPYGIRTRVTNVKGWCPRPLDERDIDAGRCWVAEAPLEIKSAPVSTGQPPPPWGEANNSASGPRWKVLASMATCGRPLSAARPSAS